MEGSRKLGLLLWAIICVIASIIAVPIYLLLKLIGG